MFKDARGRAVTLSEPKALEAYERALYAFHTYRGDPLAPLDEAIALDAGFAAAHATKALILTTFFERRFMRDALGAAAGRLAAGEWHAGTRALEQVLIEVPRDIVALQTAHLMDFYRGDALNLRNRVSRVLPAWNEGVPGYPYVLGMHAFGYEETNQYPDAERTGERAIALSGDDSWAVHAVAHVFEMQGPIEEGLAWYDRTHAVWAGKDNGFAFHNDWHRALFHMDREEHGKALAIFDTRLAGGGETALVRVDATALLWRLKLENVDVAERFAAVADAWQAALEDEGGFYAFNDFHAALAFAAAGRREALARLQESMRRAARETLANAEMTRLVSMDLVEGAIAYCEGRFETAADKFAAVRDGANRFGGSHAQRDLLSLTLIDAASRAGVAELARHYANERLVHKPASAWGRRLLERAGARKARRARSRAAAAERP